MNMIGTAVIGIAVAIVSFGTGRYTAPQAATPAAVPSQVSSTTPATAPAPAVTASTVNCTSRDELAEMVKAGEARHRAAVARDRARAAVPYEVTDINPIPGGQK